MRQMTGTVGVTECRSSTAQLVPDTGFPGSTFNWGIIPMSRDLSSTCGVPYFDKNVQKLLFLNCVFIAAYLLGEEHVHVELRAQLAGSWFSLHSVRLWRSAASAFAQ